MKAIEIVFADGSEDRVFADTKKEALDFLRGYNRRRGATVRIDPGGNMVEYFDKAHKTAIKQAKAHFAMEDMGRI